MIQGQYDPPSGQQSVFMAHRSKPLLQRHPVLVPVTLVSSSVVLCIASLYANSLFPLLTWIGVPSPLLCLLFALVLGISGILTSIIGLIERIDRYLVRTHMFPHTKEERGYDCN